MEYVKPPTEDDDDLPRFMREDRNQTPDPQKETDPLPKEIDYDELPLFMQKHFKKNPWIKTSDMLYWE